MSVSTDRQSTGREQPLIRTLVELADTLVDDYDLPDFLYRLLVHTTILVRAPSAGLLLKNPRGGVDLVASSSERSEDIEVFQLQADSGPCLDAIATGAPVRAADLAAERGRWPMWSEVALAAGFRSVYATPMTLRGQTIGALNLFGSQPHALSDEDLDVVLALTDIATIGILQERAIRRQETLAEQLEVALTSRVVIEQAKGVLAGRSDLDVSMDRAFLLLRDYSRRTNTKLGAVCEAIIDGTLDPTRLTTRPHHRTASDRRGVEVPGVRPGSPATR